MRAPVPGRILAVLIALGAALAAAPTAVAALDARLAPNADTVPPSVPQGMAFAGATRTTVKLVWLPSVDNVGVSGYHLYRNGTRVATVSAPGYTFRSLACGRMYTFALEARDAAGNVSNRAEATGSIRTSACAATTAPKPKPKPAPKAATKAPAAGTAHLWVDVNGGSCKRLAKPGKYANARACTWNQAYRAARAGDLVLVRGGDYGDVRMGPNKTALKAPGVTFKPAKGERVRVRDFENGYNAGWIGASNVRFLGPVTARTFRSDGTHNVLVSGWRVDCEGCDGIQTFHLEDARNVTVRNSNIGDNKNNSLIWISGTNITFDNNVIHDAGLPAGSPAHTECMYAWRVTNLTLRRNHFYHCSVMDVFITGGDVASGGLVENNVFEKPWENTGKISTWGPSFHFRTGGSPTPDPSGWVFRYNTFLGGLSISPGENPVGPGGMQVIGNVFLAGSPCGHANTTYAYNAFASGGCGSNAIVRSASTILRGFVNPADPGNYALRRTSVLRDKGSPTARPRVDRTGRVRPKSTRPDIGAYEFR